MTTDAPPQHYGSQIECGQFWDAAAEGRLVLPKCGTCRRLHWFPRAICPFCLSSDITWQESAGRGLIYAHTVFRRGGNRVVAYVELDEGLRLLTNISTDDPDSIGIGQAVSVEFSALLEGSVRLYPVFRPI